MEVLTVARSLCTMQFSERMNGKSTQLLEGRSTFAALTGHHDCYSVCENTFGGSLHISELCFKTITPANPGKTINKQNHTLVL